MARDPSSGWKLRTLLVLTSMLAALVLGELGARLVAGEAFEPGLRRGSNWYVVARFDAELGWANAPDTRGEIDTPDFRYRASINSHGFRDPEYPTQAAPGSQRVAFLGDSMTWGWGVNDGERFTDLLRLDLGPEVEVVNMAVPGYSTDQQFWALSTGAEAFHPDVVVLGFVLNDIVGNNKRHIYYMDKPRFVLGDGGWSVEGAPVVIPDSTLKRRLRGAIAAARSHSALWTAIDRMRHAEHRPAGPASPPPYSPESAAGVRDLVATMSSAASPTRHALERLSQWCAERSIPLLVVALPHGHDQYLYEPTDLRPEFDGSTDLTKALRALGGEIGFEVGCLDQALFDATARGRRLHGGDSHFNVEGNRLAADELRPWIQERLGRQR